MADESQTATASGGDRGAEAPLIGKVIAGKYRVLDLIANGGMGRIYRAEQVPIGRPVALKVLNPRYTDTDPNFEKRFLQEAATCGRLKNPNTVVVYDYGRIDELGTVFMAMEFIDGPTLARVLKHEGCLDEKRAVAITRAIGRSLREAHKAGIVHRDLKPSNVMLVQADEGESVKVVDFGVAKVIHADAEALTMHDNIIGSPRYMSPEQIRNSGIDGRTDIYALGVLLFEMLAGVVPFEGGRALDTLVMHLTEPFPTIRSRSKREVDPLLEAVIQKCTQKDPNDRYADIDHLLQALKDWTKTLGDDTTQEHQVGDTTGPRKGIPAAAMSTSISTTGEIANEGSGTLNASIKVPAKDGQRKRVAALAVVFGVGALLLAGIALVLLGSPTSEEVKPAVAAVAPPVAPAPAPPEPAAPVAPREVQLRIESTPTGAQVWEGNRLLGVTALDLPLAVGAAERTFVLKLSGHTDSTLIQGGAEQDVVRQVKLSAVPAPKPKPAPPKPAPVAPKSDDMKRNR